MEHNPRVEQFLRSINLRFDADYPERIEHFRPTTKTAGLLRALAGLEDERSFLIVAPYGSGKSLSAMHLLHLVENRPAVSSVLSAIADRLQNISPEISRFAAERLADDKARGLVLALHGYCPSVAEALRDAAVETLLRHNLKQVARSLDARHSETGDDPISFLKHLREKATRHGFDRLVVVWDEFGRHLESLIYDGRSAALGDLQTLAEFVSRSRELPMTVGLLMHQDLLRYAAHLPQSVRTEWKKIGERFKTLQYVDDSKEIYRLLGELIAERSSVEVPARELMLEQAKRCRELGLFTDFSEEESAELLAQAYPLEPTTLYLLPRLSARVAQNERTLFTFLHAAELSDPLGPDRLFDYFSPVMRADTSVGGTYRQWLETQTALSSAGDDTEAATALKTACLLGLGTGGERSRTSRSLLVFALDGYSREGDHSALVDQLVERKLLLHRKHGDEVSVWHGADRDLRGKLEDEKNRIRATFDLLNFLTSQSPPPAWRPLEYNDDYCIRRYLVGQYCDLNLLDELQHQLSDGQVVTAGIDGKIFYFVGESAEDCGKAVQLAQGGTVHPRIVIAVPREPLSVREVGLEVSCLLDMQVNGELVGSDPMVLPELVQMTDDARAEMQRLVDRLTRPGRFGPRWMASGRQLGVSNPRGLRSAFSELMRSAFHMTPRINNEMVVRSKVSSPIVNARKKLVMAILERSGTENLGIEGNFPDASMFRCVLLHTGLYRQSTEGRWGYAVPEEIEDAGLRVVWAELQQFLTMPDARPKEPEQLLSRLMEAPYGIRSGLLPILMSTAIKAFPSAISLTKNGHYVPDVLPSVIEELCSQPTQYRLNVLDLHEPERAFLEAFFECFSVSPIGEAPERDLIRLCFDAIESWKTRLPPAALSTKRVSDQTQRLQGGIRAELGTSKSTPETHPPGLRV